MRTRQQLEIASLLLAAFMVLDGLTFAQGSKSSVGATGAHASSTPKLNGAGARLSGIVASGRLKDLRWPDFSDYRSQLASFYRPSGYTLAWVRDGKPTSEAIELIRVLQDADREGLRAEDYDTSRWTDRLTLLNGPHEQAAEARFDAALTVCVMRYLSDLQVGRINPQYLGFEFDNSQGKLDLPEFVRYLVSCSDLHSEVAEVEPPFEGYRRLRDALPRYEELAKKDTGEKLPPYIRARPGDLYRYIPRVASLLRLLGDLPENATIPPVPDKYEGVYEGVLVDAVKHFQERHGLAPTGEIEPKTIAEMNVPLSNRVEQMRLGMERYRGLPYHFTESAIVINVPEFRLYCFEGDRPGLTMTVVVGDQYNFQTPIFEKNMLSVVFRPYWYPPPGILRNEIIPDLVKYPSLDDLELVSANGQVIKSVNITSTMFQQIRTGELTVRARPGPDNPLGLVKFMFPNKHNVYIHGTAAIDAEVYGKARAASHGCIHAEKPAELAAWVLRNNPGWDLQQVEHAMHEGRDNLRVNLASPIPVLVVYQTAVVEENGEVHFFHDIYLHDATLEEELAKGRPYPK